MPSKIIALRGGTRYTHRPARTGEPHPPSRLPAPPKHLDKIARKEWRRIGKKLLVLNMITELDRATLAGYCEAYSQWAQASEAIAKTGLIVRRNPPIDTTPVLSPMVRVARDAFDRMMRTGAELGLSPSSRARIRVPAPASESQLEMFRREKHGSAG